VTVGNSAASTHERILLIFDRAHPGPFRPFPYPSGTGHQGWARHRPFFDLSRHFSDLSTPFLVQAGPSRTSPGHFRSRPGPPETAWDSPSMPVLDFGAFSGHRSPSGPSVTSLSSPPPETFGILPGP
jgi:hypothetical protein